MTPSAWLVTGASRGIGLEFVRQIVDKGDIVFAGARSPSSAADLQRLQATAPEGRLHVIQLDVTDAQSIENAATSIGEILNGGGLDYLVNNAGRGSRRPVDIPSNLDPQLMLDVFETNVVGPAMVFKMCIPFLEQSTRQGGPVVMNMSSGVGSIAGVMTRVHGSTVTYAISKAALNMLTVKQAKEKPNMIVFAMSPGYVKTDMGGEKAKMEASDSVAQQYAIITSASPQLSGAFKRYNGEDVAW